MIFFLFEDSEVLYKLKILLLFLKVCILKNTDSFGNKYMVILVSVVAQTCTEPPGFLVLPVLHETKQYVIVPHPDSVT